MAKDDAAFFQKAAMSGMTEIAAAKVAVAQSGNPEIKNFANKMIKDQSQADNELKALAKKKGVTLPTALAQDNQEQLDDMNKTRAKKSHDTNNHTKETRIGKE